jgi:type III pantothenate kinase
MLWAVDIGNTQTVVGVWREGVWTTWRLDTDRLRTPDELAAHLLTLTAHEQVELKASEFVACSGVPSLERPWREFGARYLGREPRFLAGPEGFGIAVEYDPPGSVGPDRLANAVGALALASAPVVVVDFGTATTFDVVDHRGVYVGGAILPGLQVTAEALVGRTARLPAFALERPASAIGKTTVGSLQSGFILGYADAIDGLGRRIAAELEGEPTFLATGGLGAQFTEICELLSRHEPNLTLDGLRLAAERA